MLIVNYLNKSNLEPKLETSWKSKQFANWYLHKIKNLQPTQIKILDVAFKAFSLIISCLPAIGTYSLLFSYDISIGAIINLKRARAKPKPKNTQLKSIIATATIATGILGAYFYSVKLAPSFLAPKSTRSFEIINSLTKPYLISAKIALKAYYALGSFVISGAFGFIKNAIYSDYEKMTLSSVRGHIKVALLPWIIVFNLLSKEEQISVINKIDSSLIGSTINKIVRFPLSFIKGDCRV